MRIIWLGHSAFRIETGSSVLLVDPFLTGNGVFEASAMSVDDATAGVTHIALTHGHDDHVGDTVAICAKSGVPVIAVYELAMYLNAQGVENVDPGNPGGTIDQGDFDVSFVKAYHSASTMVDGQNVYLGNPCGLVIRSKGGKSVYHMGDTEIFGDMGLINEIFAPSVGLVPIGDRFTMGARTAAMACDKFFKFDTVIPIHYGTFPIIDQTPDKFIAEAKGQNVVVPKVGEAIEA
ncbi:MAG: metal-dependent hydrolase [Hyphomicrobiales bacterium]|nr:metal-dependent hydrolase [Hyphomicrobiales bacterium]